MYHPPRTPFRKHQHALIASRCSPAPSHAAGLHTGRSARRARWLNRAGSSTRLSCLGRLASGMRWACWAGLWFRSPHARAHAPRRHPDVARAQLRTARAPSAAAAAAAAAAGMLLLLLLLLLHPSPLEDPNLQGPHQNTRGLEPRRALVRAPPCARNFGTRSLATACSGADEPRLPEQISIPRCPESRQSQAASKGFERDAICETRESEAAGTDSTKGRRRHKGACGGGERDWDGVFCDPPDSPGPWGTPRPAAAAAATKNRRCSAANCRCRCRLAPARQQ